MAAAVAADTEAVVTEVAAEAAMEAAVMEAVAAAAREVVDTEAAVAAEKVSFIVLYYVLQYCLCILNGNPLNEEPLSSYFARTLLLCSMNMDKMSNSCTILQ